jgi:hypothetical protein
MRWRQRRNPSHRARVCEADAARRSESPSCESAADAAEHQPRPLPRASLEEAVLGPRRAEIFPQRATFVFQPKKPSSLQFGHLAVDEVVETTGKIWDVTLKPSQASVENHSSIWSAIKLGVPTKARPL